jgi:hypothetical protein
MAGGLYAKNWTSVVVSENARDYKTDTGSSFPVASASDLIPNTKLFYIQ